MTVVKHAAGVTDGMGVHQGSAVSPFLFAVMMDRFTVAVRHECPWTAMFADNTVIYSDIR